jgi:lipoprotein-anchoring transpeptidase ErfK/SrfK
MHRVWKHILIITPLFAFVALMGFLIFYPVAKPPAVEMADARSAISDAFKMNAGIYSEKLFSEAKNCYDSAMSCWTSENQKHRYSRNFNKVSDLALLATKKALEASIDAENNTANLNITIREEIARLRETDENLNLRFSKYPMSTEMRNNISKGEILLAEAELEWEKGEYIQAQKKLKDVEKLLVPTYEFADANLRSYFRSYPIWKKWADSTIAESRTNQDYSIIIDKFSRKVYVYYNGELQLTYAAELGKNWVGDKKVRGDKATPEGMYEITKKYEGDSTSYYKALQINYPNDEDTAFFEAAMEKGSLPRSAKIGGMIQIHGNGGKGADWTAGCIAVTDREMDTLFKISRIGTPVTIVGSLRDLRYALKR